MKNFFEAIKNNDRVLIIFISLAALIFSGFSFRRVSEQTIITNQGYLEVDPTLAPTIHNNDSIFTIRSINSNAVIEGLNFGVDLKNIGHAPLYYKVVRFTIFIEGREIPFTSHIQNDGILYPSQELSFFLETIPVNTIFSSLKNQSIRTSVRIEYNDIGRDHLKSFDRNIRWELHDNIIGHIYESFNDTI